MPMCQGILNLSRTLSLWVFHGHSVDAAGKKNGPHRLIRAAHSILQAGLTKESSAGRYDYDSRLIQAPR